MAKLRQGRKCAWPTSHHAIGSCNSRDDRHTIGLATSSADRWRHGIMATNTDRGSPASRLSPTASIPAADMPIMQPTKFELAINSIPPRRSVSKFHQSSSRSPTR